AARRQSSRAPSPDPFSLPRRERRDRYRIDSSFAYRFEHDLAERVRGALASPYHELEGLIVEIAGIGGRAQQRLALLRADFSPARQQVRIAEQHHALVIPDVEMADPELLVDERDQLLDFGTARLGHLEVER